jgi:hypothetical protein
VLKLVFVLFAALLAGVAGASEKNEMQYIVSTEIDAYYSNIGLYISPKDDPIPYIDTTDEMMVYRDLFRRSLVPRDIVLEASAYPMPIAGVVIRDRMPDLYTTAQWTPDFNLVKSATLGFDEPYAFSLFLGNVVKYKAAELEDVGINKGYMGYLFNAGAHHIKDNLLINDNWLEFEFKAKGDIRKAQESRTWSFRIGAKWHDHPEITDIFYLGLKRDHLGFDAPVMSWLLNSGVEYMGAFSQANGVVVEHRLLFNKKMPLRLWRVALTLEAGLIWQQAAKYSGTLSSLTPRDQLSLVLRPNIAF